MIFYFILWYINFSKLNAAKNECSSVSVYDGKVLGMVQQNYSGQETGTAFVLRHYLLTAIRNSGQLFSGLIGSPVVLGPRNSRN